MFDVQTHSCLMERLVLHFAGDWLRYGYIDRQTQIALTYAACASIALHGAIATYVTRHAMVRRQNRVVAFARGFLCGTADLLRVLAIENTEGDS